ncbi:hypothetical protein SASPL_132743 [Salvia splendens]|uniref:No apical meristem-associated C-terminal domain-containing protein n=1 Tax=Salvia splendens TaxID=180675 RepID=A0A8X8X2H6_SALSN|nr:hypothetical protein SASPL_132743 [Salvia splendens]
MGKFKDDKSSSSSPRGEGCFLWPQRKDVRVRGCLGSNPKLFSGSEASSVPKRAWVSTSGQDSVSGASIDLDTAMEETSERRPMDTKAAKRKGKAVVAPSIALAQDPQLDEYSARMEKLKNAILNKKMLARDMSSMS